MASQNQNFPARFLSAGGAIFGQWDYEYGQNLGTCYGEKDVGVWGMRRIRDFGAGVTYMG